jgi:4'-phosphopantetheinyl transferase
MVTGDLIDIWVVPFSLPGESVQRLMGFANSEERLRCRKLRRESDQLRYAVSRGALRLVLSRYLEIPPSDILFGYGEFGKPFLAQADVDAALAFNLSHCFDMSIIAVAGLRDVGVDVEAVRPIRDRRHIAETHLNQEERHFIESAGSAESLQAFLRIWTRREAAAKALGLGLSEGLSRAINSVYPPGESVRMGELDAWFLADLHLDSKHIGALCAQGAPCEIVYRSFRQHFSM